MNILSWLLCIVLSLSLVNQCRKPAWLLLLQYWLYDPEHAKLANIVSFSANWMWPHYLSAHPSRRAVKIFLISSFSQSLRCILSFHFSIQKQISFYFYPGCFFSLLCVLSMLFVWLHGYFKLIIGCPEPSAYQRQWSCLKWLFQRKTNNNQGKQLVR